MMTWIGILFFFLSEQGRWYRLGWAWWWGFGVAAVCLEVGNEMGSFDRLFGSREGKEGLGFGLGVLVGRGEERRGEEREGVVDGRSGLFDDQPS